MTARVSASAPSGPHMCPDVRIIAGIDASTMTSLGTWRLVIPLSELTIASFGPSARRCSKAALISRAVLEVAEPGEDRAEPVAAVEAGGGELVAVGVEDVGEVGPDDVAEHDRVGHLHHRGLEVDREQHVLGRRAGDLVGEEGVERGGAHKCRVDDLVLGDRHAVAQDDRVAAGGRLEPDGEGAVLGDDDGLLVVSEVVSVHRRDVGGRVRRPRAHQVGVLPGVVLHGRRSAPVRVPFAQNGVHRAALDLVVARPHVLLLRRRRLVGVVGDGDALGLQLGDGGLELRDGRGDVGQLDDVGLGRGRQLAQLGEGVALSTSSATWVPTR